MWHTNIILSLTSKAEKERQHDGRRNGSRRKDILVRPQ